MEYQDVVSLLRSEFIPAVGCTEPVAVALTCATAYHAVGGSLVALHLELSSNVFKNARAVGIPGTSESGIAMSALLGIAIGDPGAGLGILAGINPDIVACACGLRDASLVNMVVDATRRGLYVQARVETDRGSATAVAMDQHTNISVIEINGVRRLDHFKAVKDHRPALRDLGSFEDLVGCIMQSPVGAFDFLSDRAGMNLRIAQLGLDMSGGPKAGALCMPGLHTPANYAAAACNARMAGVQESVCTCAGSGNVGIAATVPLMVEARDTGADRTLLARSLAISLASTMYVKEYLGVLSPICGCAVAGGAGTAGGTAYMRGGNAKAVSDAVSSAIATLAGMLCDGGKVGCALKVWTGASTASHVADLALLGNSVPGGNGIVGSSVNDTLVALSAVAYDGMAQMDRVLVEMMQTRYGCR